MAAVQPAEASPRPPRLSARHLRRYILPGERVVLATRAHWGKLAEPVATTVASFVAVALIVNAIAAAVGEGALLLWWAWLLVGLRLLWKVLDWRNEWFVATDKRMLLMFGLVTHKVAMMPLGKVTDMSYSRSIMGRVLGYGQFILESAGQDQAMSRINWVANPDATYRTLCDTIFIPGGRGGPWGQPTQAAPPQATPTPPSTSSAAPFPPQPGGAAWAPTSAGPETDLSAAATQPIAVRASQRDDLGRLFVAPPGSTPRLAGADRAIVPPPPPPPLPEAPRVPDDAAPVRDEGGRGRESTGHESTGHEPTGGEADGPAWEVSADERGTFVPVTPWDPRSGWQATDPWERTQDGTGATPSGSVHAERTAQPD